MHSSRMRTVRCIGHRGGSAQGVYAWGGVCPSVCWDTPPLNRMTDTCENITLPQLADGKNMWFYFDSCCNGDFLKFYIYIEDVL